MSRRGQSKKRELKRTKKSVKKQLDSLHGSYIPDRAHCSGQPDEHHADVPQLPRHSWTLNEERNARRPACRCRGSRRERATGRATRR